MDLKPAITRFLIDQMPSYIRNTSPVQKACENLADFINKKLGDTSTIKDKADLQNRISGINLNIGGIAISFSKLVDTIYEMLPEPAKDIIPDPIPDPPTEPPTDGGNTLPDPVSPPTLPDLSGGLSIPDLPDFPDVMDLFDKEKRKEFGKKIMDYFIQFPNEIKDIFDAFNIFGFNPFTCQIGIPFPFSLAILFRNKMKEKVNEGINPKSWLLMVLLGVVITGLIFFIVIIMLKRLNIFKRIKAVA